MATSIHNQDFLAWTKQQLNILKSGELTDLDTYYLIEELENMGASEKRQLDNRLILLIGHLLKWVYQSEKRTKSWKLTIKEQRRAVMKLLKFNPSLKSELDNFFASAYEDAVIFASKETGLDEEHFPANNPFSLEQTLDETFFPEETGA